MGLRSSGARIGHKGRQPDAPDEPEEVAIPLGKLIGSSWTAIQRTGAVGRAVQSEVAERLEASDSSILSGLGKMFAPGEPQVQASKESQLPAGLRVARRSLKNAGLSPEVGRAVLEALQNASDKKVKFRSTRELREALGDAGAPAAKHPNLLPALLANARQHPPLSCKGRLAINLSEVPARSIKFHSHQGRVFAEITSSVNQLPGNSSRAERLAQDYACRDVSLKLTVPLGEGNARDYRDLALPAKRQLLTQALKAAPGITALVHGFQSTKEIWDSTTHEFLDQGSIGIACDGFGSNGQALSDASAPYTPKQYGFQMLETLDALGLLGGKNLKVVGHSMGGAATGEMAVALDKSGYSGSAQFILMAPACAPDHMPIFQAHRDLVDVVNAVLIGGLYVPLGAWDLTAPLVQWTDEKFPILSKMVVDHGLGLKDSPEHIRQHNADYYRTPDAQINQQRRNRSMEAMMGMATQEGLDPKELSRAAKKFGVFVANFGLDRLVDPSAVKRLQSKTVGYLEVASGSHNACFNEKLAERITAASSDHFAARSPGRGIAQ